MRPMQNYNRAGEIARVASKVQWSDIRTKLVVVIQVTTARVNLEEAEVIVSGGRGMGKPENFALSEELAEVPGGIEELRKQRTA